jgi:hypothetical protein
MCRRLRKGERLDLAIDGTNDALGRAKSGRHGRLCAGPHPLCGVCVDRPSSRPRDELARHTIGESLAAQSDRSGAWRVVAFDLRGCCGVLRQSTRSTISRRVRAQRWLQSSLGGSVVATSRFAGHREPSAFGSTRLGMGTRAHHSERLMEATGGRLWIPISTDISNPFASTVRLCPSGARSPCVRRSPHRQTPARRDGSPPTLEEDAIQRDPGYYELLELKCDTSKVAQVSSAII